MDKTDDYESDYFSTQHQKRVIQYREEAIEYLTNYHFDEQEEDELKFRKTVHALMWDMRHKFDLRTDVEMPEEFTSDDDENIREVLMSMDFKQVENVLDTLILLQNRLGISNLVKREYEMDEKGAVKKE